METVEYIEMIQTADSKGKIAWCVTPILSGVTTVYSVVGAGLRRAGWEVAAVNVGAFQGDVDARFADEYYHALLPNCWDVCRNAAEFVRWVTEQKIDVVFSLGQLFIIAAAPALPPHVRLIHRCPTITRHGYALLAAYLPRVDKIFVETPRQFRDLTKDWGVPPEKCLIVAGGIETETFTPGTRRDLQGPLKLVYLGRLDDPSKGVMLLPQIAEHLLKSGLDFHLDIIGDGPDGERVRKAFAAADLRRCVTFHGVLPRQEVPRALQQAHIFLLTSRYEAICHALLEAMASGCVPVATRIAGSTDSVVEQGQNGFLCSPGKAGDFAASILTLNADRPRLAAASAAARQKIGGGYSVERVLQDHEDILSSLLAQEPPARTPIPITAIREPEFSAPSWRRYLPQGVKNYLRAWAERFQRSV